MIHKVSILFVVFAAFGSLKSFAYEDHETFQKFFLSGPNGTFVYETTPVEYPDQEYKRVLIELQVTSQVLFTIDSYDIDDYPNCNNDVLMVFFSEENSGPQDLGLCGKSTTPLNFLIESDVTLVFTSGVVSSTTGFTIFWGPLN